MSRAATAAEWVIYEGGSIKPLHGAGPSRYHVKHPGGPQFFMDEGEAKEAYALIRQAKKGGALGKAEDGRATSTATAAPPAAAAAITPGQLTVVPPTIPLLKRPQHTFPGTRDPKDPFYDRGPAEGGAARWVQYVDVTGFPDLGKSWPEPDWTQPVRRFFRNWMVWIVNKVMQHIEMAIEVTANTIIEHLNRTIDLMFDKMIEMGNTLIGGVNTMSKTMVDTLNALNREIKAQLDSVIATLKSELAAARKAIDTSLAEAKAEINRVAASMKSELEAARKEAAKQFETLQVKLIDTAKVELEKSRKETIASIQKEAETARLTVTKAVNDAIAALPKEVAKVTAEEFQARGLVATGKGAAAPPASGGGFKWPFSGDEGAFGFVGQPDIEETADVFVQDAPEERVEEGDEPEHYLVSYARATRRRFDQDEDELGYT